MMKSMSNQPLFLFSGTIPDRLCSGPVYCLGRAGMDLYPAPVGVKTEDAEYFWQIWAGLLAISQLR